MLSEKEIGLRAEAAQEWARAASALAMRHYGDIGAMSAAFKGHHDVLTAADLAVENFLRAEIARSFAGDGVLGEEGGGAAAEILWIIDPIDGTANFARGIPHWAISIGFLHDGEPLIGLLAAPAAGESYFARRGGGAMRNGRRIGVAGTTNLKEASVEIGWSWRLPTEQYLAVVARAFAAGCVVRRGASGALGMAYVADGRIDAYAELHINSWDVAAGLVIAAEAGAVTNEFFNGDGLTKGNPILCCTPGLAKAMQEITGIGLSRTG
jgi:myo-inositol-1(or 4)-monophosphatase